MANIRPQRFGSVDSLRGITVAAMLLVNNPGDWSAVYSPLEHAQWNGFTPTDLIFPMFLFLVGVSIALGVSPRVEAGESIPALRRGVLLRAMRIVGLGLFLHLLAWWLLHMAHFRPWGVLVRIGICFGAAGLCALHLRVRTQWGLIAVLLFGYWALLASGGGYAPWSNLASRIDTAMLGPWLYQYDAASGQGHDPEGLLSTLPAIATTLLGLRAGDWLRTGMGKRLYGAGLACLASGAGWALLMPINKNLWTSSYVLWAAGWSMLLLFVVHALVDRRGWPAWGRRFGVNAIAAYAGSALMVYVFAAIGWWEPIYRIGFSNWMTPRFGPFVPSLAFAMSFVGVWWLIVRWMDRRGWHPKI
jgi:predicted acyltransferase